MESELPEDGGKGEGREVPRSRVFLQAKNFAGIFTGASAAASNNTNIM